MMNGEVEGMPLLTYFLRFAFVVLTDVVNMAMSSFVSAIRPTSFEAGIT